MKDTIFIVITRGFIIRNILRSGVLSRLLAAGKEVVVFLPAEGKSKELPEYLKTEFNREGVTVIATTFPSPRGHSFFTHLSNMLVYTDSTWMYSQVGNSRILDRAWFWKYVEWGIFSVLSLITPLKWLVRCIEGHFFFAPECKKYFDEYKPSLVFSTSIVSKADVMFMKEARRRGIPTISMPKGWDNVTKMFYRFVPDILMVQCEKMKERAVAIQRIPAHKITVTGFPQFDWYKDEGILLSREAFMESIGLDPRRKLIFFGSEGSWTRDDAAVAAMLAKLVNTEGAFPYDAALLIRPHFSDIKANRYAHLRGIPNVVVDESIFVSDFFVDNWDPQFPDIKHLTNLVHHADTVIAIASTLTLDAACADSPIINLFYGGFIDPKNGKDLTPLHYTTEHYSWVLKTGALRAVYNDKELQEAIAEDFRNPDALRKERAVLVDRLCFGNDGHSAERVANTVLSLRRNQKKIETV